MAKKRITKIRTSANYDHTKEPLEEISDEQVTIPGHSERLQDVYDRIKRSPETELKVPTYNELITADFRNMDKVEQHIFRKQMARKVVELQNKMVFDETEKEKIRIQNLETELESLKLAKATLDKHNEGKGGATQEEA